MQPKLNVLMWKKIALVRPARAEKPSFVVYAGVFFANEIDADSIIACVTYMCDIVLAYALAGYKPHGDVITNVFVNYTDGIDVGI